MNRNTYGDLLTVRLPSQQYFTGQPLKFAQVFSKICNMAYWLVKSEPSVYSWDDLVKEKQTCWSGIRNYAARLHLRSMKKGDESFFYHSNEGTEIVGIAKIVKEHYPDPTTDDDRWEAVDVSPVKKLKHPVSLERIKKEKSLAGMALIRISRLSVQPVTEEEWEIILKLAEKPA